MPRVHPPSPLTVKPPVDEYRDYHDQGGCLRSPVIWFAFAVGLLMAGLSKC